jgi:hypothetical protein
MTPASDMEHCRTRPTITQTTKHVFSSPCHNLIFSFKKENITYIGQYMFLLPHQNRSKKDTHRIEVLLGIMVGTWQIKIQPPPRSQDREHT